jgi:uncharacterized paraquat-inducible protein A
MPYLRCPTCGLLAHVTAIDHATVIHCPRCRGAQRHSRLSPLEEPVEDLSAAPEANARAETAREAAQ